MPIKNKTVLLFKSEKSDDSRDKYQELLEANNFEVMIVKTLVFEYNNIDVLQEKLLNPVKYEGLILSSPRCVNAVSQALGKENTSKHWSSKWNFTVGETTYSEALKKLGIECKGKESGNAKNLAQVIIQNKANLNKPFLFPHGNLKTDTLKLELGKENLEVEEVLVYKTLKNPNIEEEISKCTNGFSNFPEFVVFFSPSGLHSCIEYLRKVPHDLSLVKIIAIGPVTELAIQEEKLKVHGVAKNPTPEDVLKVIM